jgi:hypothetical protein
LARSTRTVAGGSSRSGIGSVGSGLSQFRGVDRSVIAGLVCWRRSVDCQRVIPRRSETQLHHRRKRATAMPGDEAV